MKKNILIINGGGGSEHDISLVSSAYLEKNLKSAQLYNVMVMTIEKDGTRRNSSGQLVELRRAGELYNKELDQTTTIDLFIPCIHGPPGETGEIQALFELMGKPYLASGPEASQLCFNKVSTKLWLDAFGIANTPWIFLNTYDKENLDEAHQFFDQHQDVFIKAASQGSSIGCYHTTQKSDLEKLIEQAFQYSSYVVIEKTMDARELEMSVYEYQGKLCTSLAGEIFCPQKLYTYEEKYTSNSQTTTKVQTDLDADLIAQMQEMAKKAFVGLKLKDLARVDFFLTQDQKLYINEINTFPGMTPISLFPQMIEAQGHSFTGVLVDMIQRKLI